MLKDDSTPIIVSSKRVFGGPGNVLGTGFQAVSQTTNPRPQGPPVRVHTQEWEGVKNSHSEGTSLKVPPKIKRESHTEKLKRWKTEEPAIKMQRGGLC